MPTHRASGLSAPKFLVTGDVVQSGGRIRVNIQIVDAESGRTIKTAAMDHPSGELLPMVDTLSLQVSSLVRAAVGHEARLSGWSASAKNAKVYSMMQQADERSDRATQLMQSGDVSTAAKALWSADSTIGEAERMAPHAAELMMEHSRVLARLSALYLQPGLRNHAEAEVLSKRSVIEADKAVAINPTDASALEISGSSQYWYWLLMPTSTDSSSDRVLAQAERRLRSSVRVDPRRASSWSLLSSLLVSRGDQSGAYLAASRAYEADAYLDNSPEILSTLFLTSYEMGNDSLSASWCDDLNRRFDHSWAGAHCRLALLAWGGMTGKHVITQAWKIAANGTQRSAGNRSVSPYLQMLVAAVIARNGFRDSAEAVIGRARVAGAGDPELLPFEADARMRLGQSDAATALVVAYVRAKPRRRIWLARSRRFANLPQIQRQLADIHYPALVR